MKVAQHSQIELEMKLKYSYKYNYQDFERLSKEAQGSPFTYGQLLELELNQVRLNKVNAK